MGQLLERRMEGLIVTSNGPNSSEPDDGGIDKERR